MAWRVFRADGDYLADRAEGLLESARDGNEPAAGLFARHGAPLTAEGARRVMEAEHGGRLTPAPADPFVAAYRAVEAGDAEALRAVLDGAPDVVHAVGTNGNDLLGMAGGDERLVTPLLERGADPARGNVHGWTPLHQAAYIGSPRLVRLIAEAGGRAGAHARGDGGTPLVVALFWGHREAAERLAALGPAPANLRVGAGLGRLELVEDAGAHRGFYRPHSGFPRWRPSDDPQEVLDEALAWAARNDRAEAVGELVARGARVEADVYRGTALAWAAATGSLAALRALVEAGADVGGRTTFGGPDHGEGATPLHVAAGAGRSEAVRLLLELGADRDARDERHGGRPTDWAAYGGHAAVAEQLD